MRKFRQTLLAAALAALLIPACDEDEGGEDGSGAVRCRERVETIQSMPIDTSGGGSRFGSLPAASRGEELGDRGTRVELDGRSVAVGGRPYAPGEATGALENARSMDRALHEDGLTPLYIAAHPSMPASQLYAFLATAPEGLEPRLVVRTGPPPTPELPEDTPAWVTELATEVQEAAPAERAVRLAQGMQRAIGTECPPMEKAFRAAANVRPSRRAELLRTGLADGLALCDCEGVDPGLESLLRLLWSERPAPPIGWIPLPEQMPAEAKGRSVQDLAGAL